MIFWTDVGKSFSFLTFDNKNEYENRKWFMERFLQHFIVECFTYPQHCFPQQMKEWIHPKRGGTESFLKRKFESFEPTNQALEISKDFCEISVFFHFSIFLLIFIGDFCQ